MYADHLDTDIHTFLERHERKELLRFVTVGSVDDGKSTLIGRLLYDTHGVYEDQIADATAGSQDGEVDLARITDGLQAEREQGITIDVAYRYFTTPKRKFIIADTPGHVQYTRNMATGASTANVAIILIDARLGVLQQSRRHAYIASLLGIPHLLVAINKMDLADWKEARYHELATEFGEVAGKLGFKDVTFIPISALEGDNVVTESEKMDWYDGQTVLGYLENVDIVHDRNLSNFRLPVQTVIRPNLDYRGFAGQIASGVIKPGDAVKVMPAGQTSRVKAIDTYDGELDEAFAPMSVTIRLEDEIDCSRGDMIVPIGDEPTVARSFEAMFVWMSDTPLDTGKSYLIKHGTRYVRAEIREVLWRADLETLERVEANTLSLNDIGRVAVVCHRELAFDAYQDNRGTGALIVIDSFTNNTVAAGMIERGQELDHASEILADGTPRTGISRTERSKRLGQLGGVVWLTGRAAAGKSTLAYALERRLFDLGYLPHVLDADDFGSATGGADADAIDWTELQTTARHFTAAGVVTIAAFSASRAADHKLLQDAVGDDHFVDVLVDTPSAVAADWDTRNRYTGHNADDPDGFAEPDFEPPTDPTLVVSLHEQEVEDAVKAIVEVLRAKGMLR